MCETARSFPVLCPLQVPHGISIGFRSGLWMNLFFDDSDYCPTER